MNLFCSQTANRECKTDATEEFNQFATSYRINEYFHSRLPRARKPRGAENVGHMLIFLERFADTSEKGDCIYDALLFTTNWSN